MYLALQTRATSLTFGACERSNSVQKICTQTNMEMYENEARIKA